LVDCGCWFMAGHSPVKGIYFWFRVNFIQCWMSTDSAEKKWHCCLRLAWFWILMLPLLIDAGLDDCEGHVGVNTQSFEFFVSPVVRWHLQDKSK
jgi:hypothetical protein